MEESCLKDLDSANNLRDRSLSEPTTPVRNSLRIPSGTRAVVTTYRSISRGQIGAPKAGHDLAKVKE